MLYCFKYYPIYTDLSKVQKIYYDTGYTTLSHPLLLRVIAAYNSAKSTCLSIDAVGIIVVIVKASNSRLFLTCLLTSTKEAHLTQMNNSFTEFWL